MKIIVAYINEVPIRRNSIKKLPYNFELKDRARKLRKLGNLAEVVFWKEVHRRKFHSIDFDRQRVIGNYIVDFYIKSLGVVVEIDGTSHNGKEAYDEKRESYLKSLELEVFRVNDFNVLNDVEGVLRLLEFFVIEKFGVYEG
jgi:very-short-patch-repair endonuclease